MAPRITALATQPHITALTLILRACHRRWNLQICLEAAISRSTHTVRGPPHLQLPTLPQPDPPRPIPTALPTRAFAVLEHIPQSSAGKLSLQLIDEPRGPGRPPTPPSNLCRPLPPQQHSHSGQPGQPGVVPPHRSTPLHPHPSPPGVPFAYLFGIGTDVSARGSSGGSGGGGDHGACQGPAAGAWVLGGWSAAGGGSASGGAPAELRCCSTDGRYAASLSSRQRWRRGSGGVNVAAGATTSGVTAEPDAARSSPPPRRGSLTGSLEGLRLNTTRLIGRGFPLSTASSSSSSSSSGSGPSDAALRSAAHVVVAGCSSSSSSFSCNSTGRTMRGFSAGTFASYGFRGVTTAPQNGGVADADGGRTIASGGDGEAALGAGRQARRDVARQEKPVLPQRGRFVDSAQLRVRGARGGPGRVSYEPVGRGRHLAATGGSGGAGGAVIIRASGSTTSLYGILPVVVAGAGGAGGANGRTGPRGADRILEVPVGTTMRIWPAAAPAASAVVGRAAGEDEEEEEEDLGGWETDDQEEEEEEEGRTDDVEEPRQRLAVGADRCDHADGTDDEDLMAHSRGGSGAGGENGEGDEGETADPRFSSPPALELELAAAGQSVVVARGGAGGRGNQAFPALAGRPASSESEPGAPGEEFWVRLETRLLADVGFVGLPNAGKSTLLGAITAARAKVGSYAFTTIRPQLGTILYGDGVRLVTADIPGLVQGAHANRGRGNAFLRHIERCRCMAYVLDLSGGAAAATGALQEEQQQQGVEGARRRRSGRHRARSNLGAPPTDAPVIAADVLGGGSGGEDDGGEAAAKAAVGAVPLPPAEQLRVLQEELRLYNPALLEAPALVVANKLDRCADPRVALRALMEATQLPIVPVSAAHRVGLSRLKEALRAIARPPGPGDPPS